MAGVYLKRLVMKITVSLVGVSDDEFKDLDVITDLVLLGAYLDSRAIKYDIINIER